MDPCDFLLDCYDDDCDAALGLHTLKCQTRRALDMYEMKYSPRGPSYFPLGRISFYEKPEVRPAPVRDLWLDGVQSYSWARFEMGQYPDDPDHAEDDAEAFDAEEEDFGYLFSVD